MANSSRSPARGAEWDALRWPVEIPAMVQEGQICALDVTVVHLSVTGCRFWAGYRLTPGRHAKLIIAGFAPIKAKVMWSEKWFAALHFDAYLHASVVDHLRARYPAEREPIEVRKGYSASDYGQ